MVVGTNPGVMTAQTGHAYAHPTNRFWPLLYESGCTSRLCKAEEDKSMPELFQIGLTNIVSRPTKGEAELTLEEMGEGVLELDRKAALFKPQAILILGVGIWRPIWKKRHGKNLKPSDWKYGWQPDSERMGKTADFEGVPVYLATSTSGAAATPSRDEKKIIWNEFGAWVQEKRKERAAVKLEIGDDPAIKLE
jgi:mismatch-specific thymine-DNA glycosylase